MIERVGISFAQFSGRRGVSRAVFLFHKHARTNKEGAPSEPRFFWKRRFSLFVQRKQSCTLSTRRGVLKTSKNVVFVFRGYVFNKKLSLYILIAGAFVLDGFDSLKASEKADVRDVLRANSEMDDCSEAAKKTSEPDTSEIFVDSLEASEKASVRAALRVYSELNGRPGAVPKFSGIDALGIFVSGVFSDEPRHGACNSGTLRKLSRLARENRVAVSFSSQDFGRIPLKGDGYCCQVDCGEIGRQLSEKGINVVDAHAKLSNKSIRSYTMIGGVFATGCGGGFNLPRDRVVDEEDTSPLQSLIAVLQTAAQVKPEQVLIAFHGSFEDGQEIVSQGLAAISLPCPVSVLCSRNPAAIHLERRDQDDVHYAIPGRNGVALLMDDGTWTEPCS